MSCGWIGKMPESRDRLSRPIDISTLLRSAARRVNLMVDEPGLSSGLIGIPVRRGSQINAAAACSGLAGGAAGYGRGWRLRRSPVDWENMMQRTAGRGRGRGRLRRTVLHSRYPRTPLRDITAVVRAIERRRALLHDTEATRDPLQQTDTPATGSQHENGISERTPMPTTVKGKPQTSPASQLWKIVLRVTDENDKGAFLTPEKKLLNSIEKVREVWLDEQRKIESTPAAKKAERERKLRVLKSMR
ncbi:hypothetical protein Nepgr_010030 [Nepenthes gracilis]|uniref:Uncharacterized protein n=1 Tax=Nepenthes gracilis TaxID=150966 RepID=A0AAD3XKY2_NEPGR|nr:hypothetical protein Nepgr_010030 [Nepenthes gracilis]